MSQHYKCRNCGEEIFWSDFRCSYLHWSSCERDCGLRAEPER